jgi:hypothetical protein
MQQHCDTCGTRGPARPSGRPAATGPDLTGPNLTGPDPACPDCGPAVAVAPVIMLMDRRPRVLLRHRVGRRAA